MADCSNESTQLTLTQFMLTNYEFYMLKHARIFESEKIPRTFIIAMKLEEVAQVFETVRTFEHAYTRIVGIIICRMDLGIPNTITCILKNIFFCVMFLSYIEVTRYYVPTKKLTIEKKSPAF